MAIVDSELQFFKSVVVSDASGNGGGMSANLITSNQQQNVFPHVFKAERDNGDTKYRKIYAKVSNDDDDTLFSSQFWLDNPTPADDWIIWWLATNNDTQGDIVGTETKYGCGTLDTDVSIGGSTIIVTMEHSSLVSGNDNCWRDAMLIGISNKPTPDSGTGTIEIHTVSGTPSVNGLDVTLTISGTLANAYTVAEGTRVFGVASLGDIVAHTDTYTKSSASGTFDDTNYPVLGDNIGSVYDDQITVTFTDATNFTVSGNVTGSLGSGTIGSDFSPTNSDFSKPYFTIPALGWGGTWAGSDWLRFKLYPAAAGIWEKRVVPSGAASLSSNSATVVFTGEAA